MLAKVIFCTCVILYIICTPLMPCPAPLNQAMYLPPSCWEWWPPAALICLLLWSTALGQKGSYLGVGGG